MNSVLVIFLSSISSRASTNKLLRSNRIDLLSDTADSPKNISDPWTISFDFDFESNDDHHPSSFCQNFNRSIFLPNSMKIKTDSYFVFNNYIYIEAFKSLNYRGKHCQIQLYLKSIFTQLHNIFQFLRKFYELIMRPEKLFEIPFKFKSPYFDREQITNVFVVLNQFIYFAIYFIFIICKH